MTAPKKQHFIYVFEPLDRPELTTNPNAWTEADNQVAAAHVTYLQQATEAGIVILAGRSLDGIGPAVVILDIQDEAAARQFMEKDPFVANRLFGAQLHPFRAAMVRKNP